MLNELLNLVIPLGFNHALFDGLHRNHEPLHVLDQNVVTGDEKLFPGRCADARTLQVTVRLTVRSLHSSSLFKIGGLVAFLHRFSCLSFRSWGLLDVLPSWLQERTRPFHWGLNQLLCLHLWLWLVVVGERNHFV